MLKLKLLLFSIALFNAVTGHAQNKPVAPGFNLVYSIATGDLNNDNLPDSVVVLQDTAADTQPYLLQIFLARPDSSYLLYLQSDSAIEADYTSGRAGYSNGTKFSNLTISAGVLWLNTELLRGHYEYKFRYQNGNFELIGFTESYSDGKGTGNFSDYNLSTGLWMEKIERYDTDKLISKTQKIIKVKTLPRLQNFTPFSTDLY